MKYIEIHINTNRVHRVEDVLPSNSKEASLFIECPDDAVTTGWWLDAATETLHEEKIWTLEEVRDQRDTFLRDTDRLGLSDFPAMSEKMKVYRQALRDMPSHAEPILDSHWPKYPDKWATQIEGEPPRLLEEGEEAL